MSADAQLDALKFPAGFSWGAATASYQIEGATEVDGRGRSIWDTFSETPGKVLGGDTGAVACDHYHRYPQDIAMLTELGLDAYRFSVAWPRIQPDGRTLEPRGLDFYDRLVDELLAAGIAPYTTLYHWDLPQVLEDEGGWPARDTAYRFADYAGVVVDRLGDRVRTWLTLNEPWCSSYLGYLEGVHAPGRTDARSALLAVHHLLLGHGLAVDVIRASAAKAPQPTAADVRVGIVLNLTHIRTDDESGVITTPARDRIGDEPLLAAVERVDGLANRLFLDPVLRGSYPADLIAAAAEGGGGFDWVREGDLAQISRPLDLLGVNYYSPTRVAPGQTTEETTGATPEDKVYSGYLALPPREPLTGMGWEQDTDAFTSLLLRIKRDYGDLPLYITENGSAWPDVVSPDGQVHDPERVAYLRGHLAAVAAATDAGVDVRGYFAWSLLDNFEWSFGYSQRFGIVRVDYDTQQRTIKDSGRHFAEVARRHSTRPLAPGVGSAQHRAVSVRLLHG
ncbi:MAG: beta-glucosidase [Nocardioidaceae bacterium]|nr:beta-glucosidase [Nocardioidaceae bacterium]